jgi:general secretion pathway protein A
MFLDHYKLREQPFGVTPDPRYLYFSPGHREALASLFYGIETGRGFLSLVAEPGMGKTTLLFQLLQRWKGYVHSAFLFQTQCDSRELFRYLLEDLGLKTSGEDIVRMHADLNDFLYRETKAGKRVVVFIDEAQNLSDSVLETVRLLSNFEAPDKKLLQIVLAGQPELAQRLSRPGLAQLRQRLAVQARLDSLPAPEVARYINHRLQVAGYEGPELFTPGAVEFVTDHSRGIPRLINNLCFHALSLGCVMQQSQVDAALVAEAARDCATDPCVENHRVTPVRQVGAATQGLHPMLQAAYSWISANLLGRRTFQASVLLLALSSLGIYWGTRIHPATAQPSDVYTADSAESGTASASTTPVAQPTPAASPNNSPDSFTYVVQPRDRIRELCLSTVGRYDEVVLTEVRRLNPGLRNPLRLEIGQEIRLPLKFNKLAPADSSVH